MADVRDLFLATAEAALEAIGDPTVADAWDRPSALPGLTVGAVAAHECRALSTVRRYLVGGAAPADATLVDAVGYVLSVMPDSSRGSDVNVAVAERATAAAVDGASQVVASAADDLRTLRETLPGLPADHTLAVLDGVAMLLDDYLETRIVELVVHHDDLAVSVPGAPRNPLPDDAGAVTVGVLAELARRRTTTRTMITALARAERHEGAWPRAF